MTSVGVSSHLPPALPFQSFSLPSACPPSLSPPPPTLLQCALQTSVKLAKPATLRMAAAISGGRPFRAHCSFVAPRASTAGCQLSTLLAHPLSQPGGGRLQYAKVLHPGLRLHRSQQAPASGAVVLLRQMGERQPVNGSLDDTLARTEARVACMQCNTRAHPGVALTAPHRHPGWCSAGQGGTRRSGRVSGPVWKVLCGPCTSGQWFKSMMSAFFLHPSNSAPHREDDALEVGRCGAGGGAGGGGRRSTGGWGWRLVALLQRRKGGCIGLGGSLRHCGGLRLS